MVLGERIDLSDGRILERDYVPVNVEGVVQGHFWCYRDVTDRERARERGVTANVGEVGEQALLGERRQLVQGGRRGRQGRPPALAPFQFARLVPLANLLQRGVNVRPRQVQLHLPRGVEDSHRRLVVL